jgi:hemoglobin-like flavoprotein
MPKVNPFISDLSAEFYDNNFRSRNAGCEYALNAFPALYKHTMRRLKDYFEQSELKLIIDIFNATRLSSGLAGQHIGAIIADSIELDAMDKKWDINGEKLIKKIENLTPFEAACIELWANGYWYANDENPDFEEYLKQLY